MRLRLLGAALAGGLLAGWLWPIAQPPASTPSPPPEPLTAAEVQWVTSTYGPMVHERPGRLTSRSKPRPTFACADRVAHRLHEAGFRGDSLRTAWAIVMRESQGQNLGADSPYFTGAYGIFQVQESAHSGKPWYSRSAMLDPDRQARLVYLHLSARGTDFRHWGIGPGGTTDTTFYGGWSSDQVYRWITEPFNRYYTEYPCGKEDR